MSDFMQPVAAPTTALGNHRILSSTAGLRVSPLCLGGMSFGTNLAEFVGSMTKEEVFGLLDGFLAAGGNFIDTANCYQDGQSESWIGEWMESRKARENVVIATKFGFNTIDRVKNRGPAWNNHWGNHRRSLQHSLGRSLERLRTEWVDILYVHWWDYTTSIPELMNSLHALVEQGKVAYLGISDSPAWVVATANSYALTYGKTPFSIYQGRWNVMFRDLEREILPMANHFGMAIACWDALGGGRLQSAKQIAERKQKGEPLRPGYVGGGSQNSNEIRMSEALGVVAAEHGVESITAVALAYVRAKYPRVFPLVGGRKLDYLYDNIVALDLTLTQAQVDYLEGIVAFDAGFPMSFTGQDFHLTGSSPMIVASQGPMALNGC